LRRNETGTGTVTLSAVAPANGAVITLQTLGAERNALIVPSAVTIARGSMSASFPLMVTSSGVSGPAEVTLTATYGGRTQSLVIRLEPYPRLPVFSVGASNFPVRSPKAATT